LAIQDKLAAGIFHMRKGDGDYKRIHTWQLNLGETNLAGVAVARNTNTAT
jgi:hypothetical protein